MPDILNITRSLQTAFENDAHLDIADHAAVLGDFYFIQAQDITNSVEKNRIYRYASVAYNAALTRYKNLGSVLQESEIRKKIAELKTRFLAQAQVTLQPEHISKLTHTLTTIKKNRDDLRQKHGIQLKQLEDYLSTRTIHSLDIDWALKQVNDIYLDNFHIYQQIVLQLTENIFEIIGAPPCEYAFTVIGSLGKLTPTSKSDLDALLLIENSEHKDFFQLYANLLSLIIIDIGETPLVTIKTPEMAWIFHLCEKDREGFTVDVGGMPIDFGPYQLLATPEEMCDILEKIKIEHFKAIDSKTYCPRLFIGNPSLWEQFHRLNLIRLKAMPEISAHKSVEYCLENFNSILDEEMYIKHEWYRQFTEGLVSLARIYDIHSTSPCEIISALLNQRIIHINLANELNQLYFLISYYLLRNYQFHDARVQQILLQSQVLPGNHEVTVSLGHPIKTVNDFFQNKVVVRKMPEYSDDRYYSVRNKKVIS